MADIIKLTPRRTPPLSEEQVAALQSDQILQIYVDTLRSDLVVFQGFFRQTPGALNTRLHTLIACRSLLDGIINDAMHDIKEAEKS